MRKKPSLILLFILAALQAMTAQDSQALYQAVAPSVVYLRHQLFMDPTVVKNPALWDRFQKLTKKPFLSTWITLASGSGFFVDDLGTILTNRHVVQVGSIALLRTGASLTIAKDLDETHSKEFSKNERSEMANDLEALFAQAPYRFSAYAGTKEYAGLTVLTKADKKDDDLALVRVEATGTPALSLAPSSGIGPALVGSDVLSFGFPLGSTLDDYFKERAVTMNKGTVSAFRGSEMLDIQHSAAISHGNSGGPLVTPNGLVIGVNTGSLQESLGNSLFYAISVAKVRKFLDKQGNGHVALWNDRLSMMAGKMGGLKLNGQGEFESSPALFLDVPMSATVRLNGVLAGRGPQILNISTVTSSLDVSDDSGVFSVTVRLSSAIQGTTTLKPSLGAVLPKVSFATNPPNAAIFADGRLLGRTPLEASLPAGTYPIEFKLEGFAFENATLELGQGGDPALVRATGQEAQPIVLGGLEGGTPSKITFATPTGRYVFHDVPSLGVPTGTYRVAIEGVEAFEGVDIPAQVGDGPTAIDLAPFARRATLAIKNIDPRGRLWIDGIEQAPGYAIPLSLTIGLHSVSLWKDGRAPLANQPIHVRGDGNSFITWDEIRGHDAMAATYGWSGLGLGVAGLLATGTGYVLGLNTIAVSMSSNYQDYVRLKGLASTSLTAGSLIFVGSLVLDWFSFSERLKFLEQKQTFKPAGVQ